ncbi:MAG TPA: four-carbon acid sugar kinase family protein [Draconibacterium sp.]|nr:four-carbon acid sugar kinase family protein [Draconibacterium sp.]
MENNKIVIIDDDPTGCQTVHDITIITCWDKQILKEVICEEDVFFILSNSRSLSPNKAHDTIKEIALALKSVQEKDMEFIIISRSDSTLRGHFYEELSALDKVFGPYDGIVVLPFFVEGNRITLNDIHYIKEGESLISVDKTEFARDPVLGYKSSHLPTYIHKKSNGFWKREECVSITIEDIRNGGSDAIASKLSGVKNNIAVVVNSETNDDLKIAVDGIKLAEKAGKKFLFRTGASFVREYAGILKKPLFDPGKKAKNCLIIAGSFVKKTTEQLAHLEQNISVFKIQIDSVLVVSGEIGYKKELLQKIETGLQQNRKVLVCTEREYKAKGSGEDKIDFGKKLSAFICALVSDIQTQPDLIISKGGITSYDVLKSGLGVRKSRVLGQVYPGIPVLKLDDSGKFPGSMFVIFPGNVGNEKTLTEVVKNYSN